MAETPHCVSWPSPFVSLAAQLFILVLLTIGCSSNGSAAEENASIAASSAEPATTVGTVAERVPCASPPAEVAADRIPEAAEVVLVGLSRAMFACAEAVVVLDSSATDLYAEATEMALEMMSPLLIVDLGESHHELSAEIARLDPTIVYLYGSIPSELLENLPPEVDFRSVQSVGSGVASAADFDRLQKRLIPRNATFLVHSDERQTALLTLSMLALAGYGMRPVDPNDSDDLDDLRKDAREGTDFIIDGAFDTTERWRVDVALSGTELPGGGTQMFPGRRLVALYGSPVTSRLGALGEQNVEATLERLRPIVASYETEDNPTVIPSFELIATVAAGSAGRDGDYSQELSLDAMREWIEFAADNDVFVVIDLQPGRANLVEQAKRYEEFLRLPNVGLAIDPEWRLGPNEKPLQRIGSATSDEVNEVIAWLVEIVHEEALPQKPLVLHQFLRRMLPDRELISTPPEVAVVVHVDGQGSLASKFRTFDSMFEAAQGDDQTLWWGWKNFYDEDSSIATPERVNAVRPLPMVITFQ